MPRTTVNIDAPILDELRRLSSQRGKSMGRLISDLLAESLAAETSPHPPQEPLDWSISPGGLLADPLDKEAIYALLDADGPAR